MSSLLPVYPPRVLALAPEMNGKLSASEIDFGPEARATDPAAVEAFRDSYAKAIQRATDARKRLTDDLCGGQRGDTFALIDAHVRAQRWLWRAAEAIVDCEDLPDDGYAQGIVWETPLRTKPEPEAA